MTDWAAKIKQAQAAVAHVAEGTSLAEALKLLKAPSQGLQVERKLAEILTEMHAEGRYVGPEHITERYNLNSLGVITPPPKSLYEVLMGDSLINLGTPRYKDHVVSYVPVCLGTVENTVRNLKAFTQQDFEIRKARNQQVKPVFSGQDCYENTAKPERWASAPLLRGVWVLTPVSVPEDTTSSNYTNQQTLIENKYQDYIRGSAHELISHLALTEGVVGVRHYLNCYGWTSTATEPAPVGAFPGRFVFAGYFDDVGFEVGNNLPGLSNGALGAFLRWNFRD
jgi:hypothetical protein